MKYLFRIFIAIVGFYIMLKLGLFELGMYVIIQMGETIWKFVQISPTAAAIGILMVLLMTGKGLNAKK